MLDRRLADETEFVDSPEPRCPVVLLLDTSYSMDGAPIDELNRGIATLEEELKKDELASLRVEVAIVTFGGQVSVVQDFVTARKFKAPTLTVNGDTPMGAAIDKGRELLTERKAVYKATGIDHFRPWLFLITDGAPTDAWDLAAERLKSEEARKGVAVFCIGVENANMQLLRNFSNQTPPLKLQGLQFRELFAWLSDSLGAVARSIPGQQVGLPRIGNWGQIDTSH